MTISDNIRTLAGEGFSVAEIARRLGIRYQHAYGVLRAEKPPLLNASVSSRQNTSKPPLSVTELLNGGFVYASRWILSETGALALERPVSNEVGVYAFARGDLVLYVGVATMGLAKRLYFYGKPGVTQRTSQRLNGIIKSELAAASSIDICIAMPPNLEWNGLPIHGSAGLELGLIKNYVLPWNMRSAK